MSAIPAPRPLLAPSIDFRTGNGPVLLVVASLIWLWGMAAAGAAQEPPAANASHTADWYPWAFDIDGPALEEIDLRFLLDGPAGHHGFLTVGKDGHFCFQDGTRARFFGTNVCGDECAPEKKKAESVAARLARFGVNLLRLHTPDAQWAGLIDYRRGDTRHFNPEALDRYD